MDHSWGYGSERRQRKENQDAFGVFEFPDFTLAVVCDGMGGHVGGAQASSLAVRTIHDAMQDADPADLPTALTEAIQAANLAIYEAARKNHRLVGMGTTAVVAAITDERIHVAHVGDSRAYLVRGDTVQHLTRDHTMVNLFVDAELLTPEDAATHPEAHVLSRSLGAEHTVEVDVAEPMPIEADDLILLCSDGVHSVITDWEIVNTDWGAPHEGVRHLLDIVISRDGDDNASAVAVLTATSFEDVPPTPVPEVKALEDSLAANLAPGLTMVPSEVDASPLYVDEPSDDPPSAEAEAEPSPAPVDDGTSYVTYDDPADAPGGDATVEKAAAPPRPKVQRKNSRVVAIAVAAVLLLTLGIGAVAVVLFALPDATEAPETLADAQPPGDEAPSDPPQGDTERAAMLTLAGDPSLHTEGDEPDPDPEQPAEEELEEDTTLFALTLPEPPRRLPHRAIRYTHPPPGGAAQWEAVQAARNHECTRALKAVARGMEMSVDHAALYSQAWFCYNENHQRPLTEARAETWEDFAFLLPHLEGSPEERKAVSDPEIKGLPAWYQPAVGGIEFRLEAFMSADRTTRLDEVIGDLLGDPTVADHLAIDLLIEATAAVGLSRQTERPDLLVDWWARRVYVLTSALHGRPGRLIEAHRPELTPVLREMLDKATSPLELPADDDGASPDPLPVPAVVTQARQVALGLIDPPSARRPQQAARPKPVAPLEPDLEDLQDFDRPRIHRR